MWQPLANLEAYEIMGANWSHSENAKRRKQSNSAKYLRQSNTKKKNTGRRKGRILPIIAKLTETLGKLLKRMEKAA